MSKKIILLLLFLCLVMFLPTIKADAATAHVYVGVQVTAASAPGGSFSATDSNWCLPTRTQISILGSPCDASSGGSSYTGTCGTIQAVSGSGYIDPSQNTTASPSCANGNIVWSNLLNLTTSVHYVIQLYTPNFCPGTNYNYNMTACYIPTRVVGGVNQSCTTTCNYYGLALSSANCTNDNFFPYGTCSDGTHCCATIQSLKGSTCTTCNAVASTGNNYYNNSTGDCYYTNAYGDPTNTCTTLASGLIRACPCELNSQGSYFYFSFTTPASF